MTVSRSTPPLTFTTADPRAEDRVLIPPTATPPPRPPSDRVWSLNGQALGASWSARVVPPPGADQAALTSAVQAEFDALAALADASDPSSEISRFNAAPAGTWELSPPLWALLTSVLDIADDTNGAVDPTLGALFGLWSANTAPDEAAIEAALAVSGWQKLRLNRDARAAVQPGGLKLDLSDLLRGLALDRASERLTGLGASSHLIEFGGEVRGAGVKPDAQPWWIEVSRAPESPAPRTVAAMLDVAVCTIADTHRAAIIDGQTGRPADNALISVTVFHASAAKAAAFATALTVMGPADGPGFAQAMGLAAHFVGRTQHGAIERMTPAFAAMTQEGG